MSWEIIQFQRDISFISSPLPFGEEAVVALSLGSGTPCLLAFLSAVSSLSGPAGVLCLSHLSSLVPLTPGGVHQDCFEPMTPQMLDLSTTGLGGPCWE